MKEFILYATYIPMPKQKQSLKAVEELLSKIELDVKRARLLLEQLQEGKTTDAAGKSAEWSADETASTEYIAPTLNNYQEDGNVQVIEGIFDGYFMVGTDKKKYPVPLNYSSKTKLIPGDVLKLRIMEDGKLIYKLIGQANRKFIKATLSKTDDNKFTAITDDGKMYFLNQAAVTYFKGKTGDELSIVVNGDNIGDCAAIEALIPHMSGSNLPQ